MVLLRTVNGENLAELGVVHVAETGEGRWGLAWLAKPGTVGRPPEGTELLVADDAGAPVPQGEVGTLYFRRQGIPLPEYHKAPEKTAASTLPGGWFTVGDVGWLDAEGDLFLADRKIDMIISGGVNVYPAEVEAALLDHPEVADVAVFGIPNKDMGEEIKCVVELMDGYEAGDDIADRIRAYYQDKMAKQKWPHSIDFTTEMPRDPNGKLYKRKLRDPYWEGHEGKIV